MASEKFAQQVLWGYCYKNHHFWGTEWWWYGNMLTLPWPNTPVLVIDEAAQRNVLFVGESNISDISFAASICGSIAFANVLRALMAVARSVWRVWTLYGNRWRLSRMVSCAGMPRIGAWAATWWRVTRQRSCITCFYICICNYRTRSLTFPARSSIAFPVLWKFSYIAFTVSLSVFMRP